MYGYLYGYPSMGGAGAVNGYESAVLSDGGTVVAIGNTNDLYSRLLGLGLINSASLVNSCNGGKESALYNFVPSPVQSLDRFTVTRASTKLRIGSNGLYGSVANNVPAFEFNTDGTYRGLLVEPGATNLALQSQAFNEAAWSKAGVGTGLAPVVTANDAVAPDGTTTADLVVFDRGAGNTITDRSVLSQAPTVVNGSIYTSSFFIKASAPSEVGKQLAIRSAQVTYGVITITADWVRYERPDTQTSTLGNIELTSRGTITTDNMVSVHLWQAQHELGSVATSPIVTTSGTASRVADVVSLTGASSLIGQSAGFAMIEVDMRNAGINRLLMAFNDGTNNNRIALQVGSANTVDLRIVTGGVLQGQTTGQAVTTGVQKWGFVYSASGVILSKNGSTVATLGAITIPSTTIFDLLNAIGGSQFNGWGRSVAIGTSTITEATLNALTTL